MNSIRTLYKNAYAGLSAESWMLAVVILINRSGSMVIPFLSIYLTSSLGYGVKEAGYILSMYGLGSIVGGFGGGWLTDRVGHFRVQYLSLVVGGLCFIGIAFVEEYYTLMIGIFVVSMIAESLRPANTTSISFYAKPENLTRAFSLNRMAINLGFSIGPALGGLLAAISFKLLFIADGITCMIAGLVFYFYFKNRKGRQPATKAQRALLPKTGSPFGDPLYIVFVLLVCLYATMFFQLFMTLPLYYKGVYELSEGSIGLMLGLNGAIVFGVEMILVYVIGTRYKLAHLISVGTLLIGIAFMLLVAFEGVSILVLSMIFLSISEILAMPYMATLAVERSVESNRGAYVGLYTVSYSGAFVLAPLLGSYFIDHYGFDVLWEVISLLSVVCAFGLFLVVRKMVPRLPVQV